MNIFRKKDVSRDRTGMRRHLRLLEIKDYISEGLNIAAIKKKYAEREAKSKKPVSQTEVRRALRNEVLQQSRFASQQSPFGRG